MNYVMNQFGVKGQRPWRDPGATPPTVNSLPYFLEKITFKIPKSV